MTADPEPTSMEERTASVYQKRPWAVAWVCVLFLLAVPMMLVIVERVKTPVSREIEGGSMPAGWYFRSGQWLADARTFSAACQFLMQNDGNRTGPRNFPGVQLARPDTEATSSQAGLIKSELPASKDS